MLDATSHAGSSRSGPLLSAVSISKRYGDFLANDGIDLDLLPAEIHALLGENGAGKSTLVKTMYGLIQPSGGELRWMGQKIVLAGPSEARNLGIQTHIHRAIPPRAHDLRQPFGIIAVSLVELHA
jgi:simple sugar transport system ATP-binding protein